MQFVVSDGGRALAGYSGKAGDCVARAIAIAADMPYEEVYQRLASGSANERQIGAGHKCGVRSARNGIHTSRRWFKAFMQALGFKWTPTMLIGSGCKVHLRDGQLPMGRLVVMVSRHTCAVIDGVLHDTYDGSRQGNRCVYGYWRLEELG